MKGHLLSRHTGGDSIPKGECSGGSRVQMGMTEPEGGATEHRPVPRLGKRGVPGTQKMTLFHINARELLHLIVAPSK